MNKSESIKELAAALSKAQGELKPAELDCFNPFFKSRYASLLSVTASCKEALAKNGLSVTQVLSHQGETLLETCLMHSSGEFISGSIPILASKADMQGLYAACTYGRRLGLSAILGIVADEDDDGNSTPNTEHSKEHQGKGFEYTPRVGPPKLETYIIPMDFGKGTVQKGKKIPDYPREVIEKLAAGMRDYCDKKGIPASGAWADFLLMADQYVNG